MALQQQCRAKSMYMIYSEINEGCVIEEWQVNYNDPLHGKIDTIIYK